MKYVILALFIFIKVAFSFERKPNVILILADDLGYKELGSYGQKKIKTLTWITWQKRGCVLLVTTRAMRYVPPHGVC